MAEAVSNILNGGNAIPVLGFILILVLISIILMGKGLISFQGKGLSIGNEEKQLTIVRRQIEYSKSELDIYFEEMIRKHSKYEWFNKERCLYCKEIVYDVIVEAIALNHITKDEFYTRGKLIKVWAELSKLDLSKAFTTDEFKDECYKEVCKILYNLVDIREYYSKKRG